MKHCLILALWLTVQGTALGDGPLLVNGDFEFPPILGPGQSGVPIGGSKWITTSPVGRGYYDLAISGIFGWRYATPFDMGTHSDHGLARRNANFGLPSSGQSAFINNWNRLMSQTVFARVRARDTVLASINFGTLGSATDSGRAGRFYLVAGEADPLNLDQFSARSIILAELSVANPTWGLFTPDVVVDNRQYIHLNLSYTYRRHDPALRLPITVAFRTVTLSVGPTYWDDASLKVQHANDDHDHDGDDHDGDDHDGDDHQQVWDGP